MTSSQDGQARRRRLPRILLVAIAVLVVLVPMVAGLVLAWQVHPLLVVPAYLLGIPAWLTLLSAVWSLVGRLRRGGSSDEPSAPAAPAAPTQPAGPLPRVTTTLRLPAPRTEPALRERVVVADDDRLRTPIP